MTSAQASKLLRRLNEKLRTLEVREENSQSVVAALQEDIESVRPAYDFAKMREEQDTLETRIRLFPQMKVSLSSEVRLQAGILKKALRSADRRDFCMIRRKRLFRFTSASAH